MDNTYSLTQHAELLKAILRNNQLSICQYLTKEDALVIYDRSLAVRQVLPGYLRHLEERAAIHPEDRWKVQEFFQGKIHGEMEVRLQRKTGPAKMLVQILSIKDMEPAVCIPVAIRDVTQEKHREAVLEDQAKRDSLTMLYNRLFGRELIGEYLKNKDPYATCGMIMIDVDYFKYANDTYGHLFGDEVLAAVARILRGMFDKKDVLMRAGGDEFVVFLKDISHSSLVKKTMQLIKSVRELRFEGKDYAPTCSAGVCFLPENISGYTYDQLFENADWALYRAKIDSRNLEPFD